VALPVDTANRVDPVAELVATYRRFVRDIARRLADGRLRPDAYLVQQVRFVVAALEQLDRRTARWARTVLRRQYALSAGAARFTLRMAGIPELQAGFGDFDRRALRALIERTSANLGNIRQALATGLIGGTPRESVLRMRAALAGDNRLVQVGAEGAMRVAVPSGRTWDPEAYSRMLSRTAVADTRRVAFRQRYLSNGIDVVRVVANGTVHDVCAAWEGELLSLTGDTSGLPTVADARAAGLFHPNCRHRYVAVPAEQPQAPLSPRRVPAPEPALATLGEAPPTVRVSIVKEAKLAAARAAGL
jgi:hypothetical protein